MSAKVQKITTMIVATIWFPIAMAIDASEATVMVGIVASTFATVGYAMALEKRYSNA